MISGTDQDWVKKGLEQTCGSFCAPGSAAGCSRSVPATPGPRLANSLLDGDRRLVAGKEHFFRGPEPLEAGRGVGGGLLEFAQRVWQGTSLEVALTEARRKLKREASTSECGCRRPEFCA